MNNTLFLGFKGKNNTSCMLAEQLSPKHLLLTNSFTGLKKDIDSISGEYNQIVMFGVDKELSTAVRIERVAAKNGIKFFFKTRFGEACRSHKLCRYSNHHIGETNGVSL